MNKIDLLDQIRQHYHSHDQILALQQKNFRECLSRFLKELEWWLGDTSLDDLEDIRKLPIRTGLDIINQQKINPPYGVWNKGQVVFTSSASTNDRRKAIPRSWENYLKYLVSIARTMENHGVGHDDVIMTTDPGGMFSGHTGIEDAAMHILGATRIRCSSSLPSEKLKVMEEFGVTVLSGNPTKLSRMARLEPKRHLSKQLKMVISTGSRLDNNREIADAFGVDRVVDMYGSAELGNVAWTCNQGHFHVNIDLCYIEQGRYFSNLSNLPILRYEQGEEIYFSYKGTCGCGSNLPTVDKLISSTADRSKKD